MLKQWYGMFAGRPVYEFRVRLHSLKESRREYNISCTVGGRGRVIFFYKIPPDVYLFS